MIVMAICYVVVVFGFVAAGLFYDGLPDDATSGWRLTAGGVCFLAAVLAALVGMFTGVYLLGASS